MLTINIPVTQFPWTSMEILRYIFHLDAYLNYHWFSAEYCDV